jgi:hypothetical protein
LLEHVSGTVLGHHHGACGLSCTHKKYHEFPENGQEVRLTHVAAGINE